jgi:hypothetical protein
MKFAADEIALAQALTPSPTRCWRAAADAFVEAVRAHQSAFDGQAAMEVAFASARPFFPSALRDALYGGAWRAPFGIDYFDEERLEGWLRERRYLDHEVAFLVAVYREWREATTRVETAVGHKAFWEKIRTTANARERCFLAMLATPPPDLETLAEKIQLTADELGWADDPRVQQVASLAQDARRLCAIL